MKIYTKYISEIKEDFDWLDDMILKYCLIYEMYNRNAINRYHTFESIGIFDGCKEIVKKIIDNFIKYIDKKEVIIKSNEIEKLNERYFDELHVKFLNDDKKYVHGLHLTGYRNDEFNETYENKRWNKENNKFNFIEISIYNASENNAFDVAEILTHELIHSWDDYVIHKYSYSSYRDKTLNFKLKNRFNELSNLLKDDKDKNDLNIIQQVIYYLDKFEVKAYIGQLNKELDKYELYTVRELMNVVRNNDIYKTYKYIYELSLKNENNIFIENGATKSQLNQIRKLAANAWSKVVNHTYLACISHVKEPINPGSTTVSFFDMMTEPWKRK